MKHPLTGQMASFEDKAIQKAASQRASRTIKTPLFFFPHTLIPCLEIYPMEFIQEKKEKKAMCLKWFIATLSIISDTY